MTDKNRVREILRAGAAAISPYNTQPWRFRVCDDEIEIFILRTKNFFLKLQGVSHMTLGCLLENLLEGARHQGYRASYEFIPGVLGHDAPCARVRLVADGTLPEHGIAHLFERATNRRAYQHTRLSEAVSGELHAACDDPNVTVFYSEGADRDRLAEILSRLELVRVSNYKMIREAFEYIRLTESEMQERPEGLDVRTLELDPRIARLVPSIRDRRIYWLVKCLGVAGRVAARHRANLEASAGIVVYAIDDKDEAGFVRLGMVVQKTLNRLARLGVQSMPVLSGLYLLDVLGSNPEIFSRRETRILHRSRDEIEQFFGRSERDIVFVVRVGYGDPPRYRQGRRELEDLVLDPG
ncbi:MAG: hypothetical protein KAJ97_06385 [Acidobacteria bacterium]|nr:hypothetical protein [Acidobacteriota bacterium]